MSRILIYSQQPFMGGSLRMLVNLAHHLARRHEVCFALPMEPDAAAPPAVSILLKDIPLVDAATATASAADFDLLVGHFPFSLDLVAAAPFSGKVAVITEIVDLHGRVLDDRSALGFDRIIHLHDEQVAELDASLRDHLCVRLPIIDNIDFEPGFAKTGVVGAVGGIEKHDLATLTGVLQHSKGLRGLHVWCTSPVSLRGGGLSRMQSFRALRARASGRLKLFPPELDVSRLYASFDCLLHTPDHGNGTSIAVADALACGKLVVLSPLDANREAYADARGVHFIDELGLDLTQLVASYDRTTWAAIRADRALVYDRAKTLERWEETLLATTTAETTGGGPNVQVDRP